MYICYEHYMYVSHISVSGYGTNSFVVHFFVLRTCAPVSWHDSERVRISLT